MTPSLSISALQAIEDQPLGSCEGRHILEELHSPEMNLRHTGRLAEVGLPGWKPFEGSAQVNRRHRAFCQNRLGEVLWTS